MGALKPWHIAIFVVVLVLLFGAKRLPDAARSLGRSLRIIKAETKGLIGEAGGTGKAQGQWLDDQAAADFLAKQRPSITKPTTVDIPEGLGRVVNPDGSFSPASQATLVPSPGGGYRTAYPVP